MGLFEYLEQCIAAKAQTGIPEFATSSAAPQTVQKMSMLELAITDPQKAKSLSL